MRSSKYVMKKKTFYVKRNTFLVFPAARLSHSTHSFEFESKEMFVKPKSFFTFPPRKLKSRLYQTQINFFVPNQQKKYSLNDFTIGELAGEGSWSSVYEVVEKNTNKTFAMKVIPKYKLFDEKLNKQIQNEILIHSTLKHRNIIELFGSFESDSSIHLIIEFALHGELFHILRSEKIFSNERSATYIRDIAKALEYCHNNNVIHRDLKLENILLSQNGDIKIADFGWAKQSLVRSSTFCGTLEYLSPEMIFGNYYGFEVDLWSLGILMHEFLVGKTPFSSTSHLCESKFKLMKEIMYAKFSYNTSNFCNLSQDLIEKLLDRNINTRLTAKDIPKHPWIIKYATSASFFVQ